MSAILNRIFGIFGIFGILVGCLLLFLSTAKAACRISGLNMSETLIREIQIDPIHLISLYPKGGYPLSSAVSWFTIDNPSFVQALGARMAIASRDQRIAIAKGLSSAYQGCLKVSPSLSARIGEATLAIRDPEIQRVFRLIYGDSYSPNGTALRFEPLSRMSSQSPNAISRRGGSFVDLPPSDHSGGSVGLPNPFGPPESWR